MTNLVGSLEVDYFRFAFHRMLQKIDNVHQCLKVESLFSHLVFIFDILCRIFFQLLLPALFEIPPPYVIVNWLFGSCIKLVLIIMLVLIQRCPLWVIQGSYTTSGGMLLGGLGMPVVIIYSSKSVILLHSSTIAHQIQCY